MANEAKIITQEDLGGPQFEDNKPFVYLRPNTSGVVSDPSSSRDGFVPGYIPGTHNKEYYAASRQSGLDLLINAGGQFLTELGLGTIEAVGYLGDLENIGMAFKEGEKNFDNWLSNIAGDLKADINESAFKIYNSPQSEKFSPLNGRWWAVNAANIATGFSLMIPSLGVGKLTGLGIKIAGQLAKSSKTISKFASAAQDVKGVGHLLTQAGVKGLQGLVSAGASRHAESLMEANQVYEELINSGYSQEEAGEAAAKVYRDNSALIATDIIQYVPFFMGMPGKLSEMFSSSAKKITFKSTLVNSAFNSPFEAIEEGYQYITSEEAKKIANKEVEPGFIWGKGVTQRISDYVKEDEFLTSSFLGAIGGVFQPVAMNVFSKGLDAAGDVAKNKSGWSGLRNKMAEKEALISHSKTELIESLENNELYSIAFSKANRGELYQLKEDLKSFEKEATDQEEIIKIKEMIEKVDHFEGVYDQVMNKNIFLSNEDFSGFKHLKDASFAVKFGIIADRIQLKSSNDLLTKYNNRLDEAFAQSSNFNPEYRKLKELQLLKNIYEKAEKGIVQISENTEEDAKRYEEIKSLYEEEKALLNNPSSLDLITGLDEDALESNLLAQEIEKAKLNESKKNLDLLSTPKGTLTYLQKQDAKQEEIEKLYKEHFDFLISSGISASDGTNEFVINSKNNKYVLESVNQVYDNAGKGFTPIELVQFMESKNIKITDQEKFKQAIQDKVKKQSFDEIEKQRQNIVSEINTISSDQKSGLTNKEIADLEKRKDQLKFELKILQIQKSAIEKGVDNEEDLISSIQRSVAIEDVALQFFKFKLQAARAIKRDLTKEAKKLKDILLKSGSTQALEKRLKGIKSRITETNKEIKRYDQKLKEKREIGSSLIEEDKAQLEEIHSQLVRNIDKLQDVISKNKRAKVEKEELNKLIKKVEEIERDLMDIEVIIKYVNQDPQDINYESDLEVFLATFQNFERYVNRTGIVYPWDFYNTLAGNHYPGDKLNKHPSEQRYFFWVQNNAVKGKGYKIKFLRQKDHPELLSQLERNEILKLEDGQKKIDEMVFAVVVNSNNEPININNEVITNIGEEGIYSKLKNPETKNRTLDQYLNTLDSEQEKKDAIAQTDKAKKDYASFRNKIEKELEAGNQVFVTVEGKTTGFVSVNMDERIPALSVVSTMENASIEILNTSLLEVEGHTIRMVPGTVLVRDSKTGNAHILVSRLLKEEDVSTITTVLQRVSNNKAVDNPFDFIIDPKSTKTAAEVLHHYLFYKKPDKEKKHGVFYEIIKNNKWTGDVYMKGLGIVKLSDFFKDDVSTEILKKWLREQYHNVSSSELKKEEITITSFIDGEIQNKKVNTKEYFLKDLLVTYLTPYSDDITQPQRRNSNLIIGRSLSIFQKKNKTTQTKKLSPADILAGKVPAGKKPGSKASSVFGNVPMDEFDEEGTEETNDSVVTSDWELTGESRPSAAKWSEKHSRKIYETIPNETGEGKRRVKEVKIKNVATKEEKWVDERMLDNYLGKARRINNLEPYTKEDIDSMREWFGSSFSGVEFDVVFGLVASGSFGLFTTHGKVLLDPYAEEGTLYHESFHVAIGLYHTRKEANKIFNEYRTKTNQKNLSNSEVEEILAEDFRNYMLSGEVPKYLEKNWFQKIKDFIKWVLGLKEIEINDIFQNLKKQKYYSLKPNFANLYETKHRLTSGFKLDAVKALNTDFWLYRMTKGSEKQSIVDSLLSEEVSKKDLKAVYEESYAHFQLLKNYFQEEYEESKGLEKEKAENSLEFVSELLKNFWSDIVPAHFEYLKKYSVEIDLDVELGFDENESSGFSFSEDYSTSFINISKKTTSTNQIKMWLSSLPETKYNPATGQVESVLDKYGIPVLQEFNVVFNRVLNKLQNTTSVDEMINVISSLEEKDPIFRKIKQDFLLSNSINPSAEEFVRKMQFFQTFSNFKNDFYRFGLYGEGNSGYMDASFNSGGKLKLLTSWESSLNLQEEDDKKENKKRLSKNDIKRLRENTGFSFTESINIAKKLGVEANFQALVDPAFYNEIIRSRNRFTFINSVNYLAKQYANGVDIYNDRVSELNKLVKIAQLVEDDRSENGHINLDGRSVYDVNLYSYYSKTLTELNKIAQTVEFKRLSEKDAKALLFERFKYLNNSYSSKSKIIKKILQGKQIETHIFEGVLPEGKKGVEFTDLSYVDNYLVQLLNTLDGKMHMIRPGDNKLERTFDTGMFVSVEDIIEGTENATDIMLNYLREELEFLKELKDNPDKSSGWLNLSKNLSLAIFDLEDAELTNKELSKAGLFLSIIQDQEVIDLIKKYVSGNEEIESIINNDSLITELGKWYAQTYNEIYSTLQDFGITQNELKKFLPGNYAKVQKSDFAQATVETFLINYVISTVEQTKIFTGHPGGYKNLDDFLKRMSGMVGTKQIPNTDESTNKNLDDLFGIKNYENVIPVTVYDDVNSFSEERETYVKAINERYEGVDKRGDKAYDGVKETDAAGLIHIDTIREFLLRLGKWDYKQELTYLWEKQGGWKNNSVVIPANTPFKKLKKMRSFPYDKIGTKGYIIPLLKPQYFGPLENDNIFIPGFFKLALFPMLPSIIDSFQMKSFSNKKGIVTFLSASKADTRTQEEGLVQPLYDSEGNVNIKAEFINTHLENWGIQVENAPVRKNEISNPTQFHVRILDNLIGNGVPVDYKGDNWEDLSELNKESGSDIYKKIKQVYQVTEAVQDMGVGLTIKKLGLRKENGNYVIEKEKMEKVKKHLKLMLARLGHPTNMIDAIDYLDKGVDVIIDGDKLEQILLSSMDKMTVSMKKPGKSPVIISSALFEKGPRRWITDDKIKDSDLKFYQNKDGKITDMEIYLPHYFKEIIADVNPKDIDKRLLEILGFRIPTQSLSSIDKITIKGFLSPTAGDYVVLPSMAVEKVGLDFDFDKMFMLLPHYYIENGQIKYDEYTEDLEELDKRKVRIMESNPLFKEELNDIKEKYDRLISLYDSLGDEESSNKVKEIKNKEIEDLLETFDYDDLTVLQKNGFGALFNRQIEIYRELMSMSDRFSELITPTSTITLKNLSVDITNKTAENKGTEPKGKELALHHLLNPNYLFQRGLEYSQAKKNIGVGAAIAKAHTLFSQAGVYINSEVFEGIELRKINKVIKNGKEHVSLGGLKDSENKYYISDLLNEFLSSFVDAAKDPFIFAMNGKTETIPAILSMVRAGVPIRQAFLIANQPIIHDYLKLNEKNKSAILRSLNKKTDVDKALVLRWGEGILNKGIAIENINSETILENSLGKEPEEMSMMMKDTQLLVLNQFKIFEKLGVILRDANVALSYDTSGINKSTFHTVNKLSKTRAVEAQNVLINFNKLFGDSGYMKPYQTSTRETAKMITPYLFVLNNKNAASVFYRAMDLLPLTKRGIGTQEKLLDSLRRDFITYLVQTKYLLTKEKTSLPLLKEEKYRDLIIGRNGGKNNKNTLAQRINDLKTKKDIDNSLINDLTVFKDVYDGVTKVSYRSISLSNDTTLDSITSDYYTSAWKELETIDPVLSEDLAMFLFLQTGLQKSPLNFIKIIPHHIYFRILNQVLNNIGEEVKFDKFIHEFFINNINEELWTKVYSEKRRKESSDFAIIVEKYNEQDPSLPIYSYYLNGEKLDKKKLFAKNDMRRKVGAKVYLDNPLDFYTISDDSKSVEVRQITDYVDAKENKAVTDKIEEQKRIEEQLIKTEEEVRKIWEENKLIILRKNPDANFKNIFEWVKKHSVEDLNNYINKCK